MPDVPPSVFLVAGNRLLRETLAKLLNKRASFSVCGVYPYTPDICQIITSVLPDILVLDSVTARLSDCAIISEILTLAPSIKVALIDMDNDPRVFLECARVGAVGYFLEDASATEVVIGVQAIARGQAIYPPEFCIHLLRAFSLQCTSQPGTRIKLEFGLTRRQQELVPLIAQGLTNKEIAAHLNISEQTVKNHVHIILRRVGASDRMRVAELTRVWGAFQ